MGSDLIENQNNLITVEKLLNNKYFRIPIYQRGYAWEADNQFQDLWNDIMRLKKTGKRFHYTGMLAMERITDENDLRNERLSGKEAFYIVDGQQRITSIIIILKAILDYIRIFDIDYADKYQDLFLSNYIYKFDYSSDRQDNASKYFKKLIFEGVSTNDTNSKYMSNIKAASDFINKKIKSYSTEEARNIFEIILNKIIFNLYIVTKDFDVRVTFETMNNRGKKLSNLELLKNRLLYLLTFLPIEYENQSNNLKDKINEAWDKIYTNLSSPNIELDDDEYLRAHWMIYNGLTKKRRDDYIKQIFEVTYNVEGEEISRLLKENRYKDYYEFLSKYIDDLAYYSEYWKAVKIPEESNLKISNDIKSWICKLSRISPSIYVHSATMVYLACKELADVDKIEFFKNFEQFIFVNKLLAQEGNDLSSFVTDAKELKSAKDKKQVFKNNLKKFKTHEISITTLKDVEDRIIRKFADYIKDRKDDGYYKWNGLKYFLIEYDEDLTPSSSQISKWDWKNISIEHILPQTIKYDYWKIAFDYYINKNDNQEQLNHITNSLGNLILLSTGTENSELSNHSYPIKRSYEQNKFSYSAGAHMLSKDVANKSEYWTPKEIYSRNEAIFDFMFTRWFKDFSIKDLTIKKWHELVKKFNLINFEYNEISDLEYKNLTKELDKLDLSNEKNKISEYKIYQHKSTYEEDKLMDYMNREELNIWYNRKSISCTVPNSITFVLDKDENSNLTSIRFGVNINDNRFKGSYEYKNNEIFFLDEGKGQNIKQAEIKNYPLIDLFLNSFYRYLKIEFNKDIPKWLE